MSAFSSRWLTWPNLLTAVRALLILPLAYTILNNQWIAGAVIFTVAALSDYWDGKLARALNQTSAWGGLFDHATDAAFVACACWALAEQGLINFFLWPLIGIAFVQYMLDSKALIGQTLRTSILGRNNGVGYFVLVGTAVGSQVLEIVLGTSLIQTIVPIAAWALALTTVISILDRAWTLIRKPS